MTYSYCPHCGKAVPAVEHTYPRKGVKRELVCTMCFSTIYSEYDPEYTKEKPNEQGITFHGAI